MDTQTFTGITPDRFEKLKTQAASAGLHIDADEGAKAVKTPLGNVDVKYIYARTAGLLTITILKHPFIEPAHVIMGKLKDLVDATA